MYRSYLKRVFDFTIAIFLLIVLFPLIMILFLLLLVSNKGTPLFMQARPGKNSYIYRVVKFKTMNDLRNSAGVLLPDKERLTRIGRFVRTTSLDEIPQLYNVLKGNMSIVGPRPLLIEYLTLYNKKQERRQEVNPGITGWAQVNGRNSLSWEEKFELDVWYVDNLSFRLDMKIIFLTIWKVLKREGINSGGAITMERFRGSGERS